MISNELLKKKILEKAFHGLLVSNKENLHKVNFQNTYQGDYNIPNNWCWIKYEDIADSKMGKTILAKDLVDNGIPVYSATQSDKIFGYVKDSNILLNKGDIVIPARGNSIGCATLITEEKATCTQTTIYSKIKNKEILPKYLLYCCKYFKEVWFKYSGAAIPQVTVRQINQNLVPVAPIEEQKEIVEKIDSLYKLIDKKEQNDQEKNKLKETLKNKILEEAMHGTLVDNDLSLKPVDVKEMINDIPFKIPDNWIWTNFDSIGYSSIGLTYKPTDIKEDGTIVLRSSNIQNGKLKLNDIVRVNTKIPESLIVHENDILICARNGSKSLVGKSCLLNELKEKCTFGAFMSIFRTEYYNYVYWFMQSKYYYYQLTENTNTMTINQLTQNKLKSLLIPLPPIEQQEIIVSKINELFTLVEKL